MRIVLAVDGSPSSLKARDLVASLAWPSKTGVTVVTATEEPAVWIPGVAEVAGTPTSRQGDDSDEGKAALAEFASPLHRDDLTIELRVVAGRAPDAILSVADELEADLIVLGSRGHGRIRSMLLGSVSAEVADRAACSVLVARHPSASRLIVATDGSDCASVIPAVLGEWQVFRDMPADVLSVAPVDSPTFEFLVKLYTLGSESLEPLQADLETQFRGHAAAMAERLATIRIPAHPETRSGDAAHEIITFASERDADLVVVGSRCLHGLDRWLLGSVARNVLLHTEASVLIVRDTHGP